MNNFFKNLQNLKIKENDIYLIITFLVYGFYGSGTNLNSEYIFFYYLFPIFLIPLIFIFKKNNDVVLNLKDLVNPFLNKENLIIFFILTLIMSFLSFERLVTSIADDEYAYTNLALIHSIQLSVKLLVKLDSLQNMEISFLIQIISLFLFLSLILFTIFLLKILANREFLKVLLVIISIFVLRTIIVYFGGNTFPHPPLMGVPLLVSTAFFGISDISLKLTYFLLFLFFVFFIFLKFNTFLNKYLSLLLTISLFTIPGVLYLGSTIEQALWTTICFSIILLEIIKKEEINYKKLFIIIMIFSFLRILSLLSVAAIIFFVLFKTKSIKTFANELKKIIKSSYPLFFLIPFISFSFLEYSILTLDRVGFDAINLTKFLSDFPIIILDNFTIPAGILVFVLFLISLFYKSSWLLISFILVLVTVYINVIKDSLINLHDSPKYLYEIFFPYCIVVCFIFLSKNKKIFLKNIFTFSIGVLLLFNIHFLQNYSQYCLSEELPFKENHTYIVNFGCDIHISHPFNLKESYNYLKQVRDFRFGNLYVPGIYYGMLPSIINGIKLKDINMHRNILENQNKMNLENGVSWLSANSRLIDQDQNINFVIVADMIESLKLTDGLIDLGWKKIFENKDENFKTISTVLRR